MERDCIGADAVYWLHTSSGGATDPVHGSWLHTPVPAVNARHRAAVHHIQLHGPDRVLTPVSQTQTLAHVHPHAHAQIHACTRGHTHGHTRTNARTHTRTCMCTCIHLHACTRTPLGPPHDNADVIFLPALVAIMLDLKTTMPYVAATMAAPTFINGFASLLWGPFCDRFGRRPTFLISTLVLLAFTAGSAAAPNIMGGWGWGFGG